MPKKKYLTLVNLLQARNKEKVQVDQLMEKSGFKHDTSFRLGSLLPILGPQHIANMYDLTEKYINLLDESIVYTHDKINILTQVSGRIFNKHEGKRIQMVKDKKLDLVLAPLAKPKFKTKEELFVYIEEDIKDMSKKM